ncbi:MAG: hypothetical protein M3375_09440 [Actinomycetota bacterium]|nr:hypothetical protein [Actinomycetota bacterium]
MQPLADRAYLSLSSAAIMFASPQPEAPGGRGDDPGKAGGLAVVLGIAIAFLVAIAVVFFLLRSRSRGRTNPKRPPKSPRGRTGV